MNIPFHLAFPFENVFAYSHFSSDHINLSHFTNNVFALQVQSLKHRLPFFFFFSKKEVYIPELERVKQRTLILFMDLSLFPEPNCSLWLILRAFVKSAKISQSISIF